MCVVVWVCQWRRWLHYSVRLSRLCWAIYITCERWRKCLFCVYFQEIAAQQQDFNTYSAKVANVKDELKKATRLFNAIQSEKDYVFDQVRANAQLVPNSAKFVQEAEASKYC